MVESMTTTAKLKESAPLWGALLLSGGAWSIHLLAGQFAVEAVCTPVAATSAQGQFHASLWIVLLLVSLVTFLVALGGTIFAWVRRTSLERRGPGLERAADLSPVVIGLSAFFAFLIVIETIPLLLIGCGSL